MGTPYQELMHVPLPERSAPPVVGGGVHRADPSQSRLGRTCGHGYPHQSPSGRCQGAEFHRHSTLGRTPQGRCRGEIGEPLQPPSAHRARCPPRWGPTKQYMTVKHECVPQEGYRQPDFSMDGTATRSLTVLQRALWSASDRLPPVHPFPIWCVARRRLRLGRDRGWCPTGCRTQAQERNSRGVRSGCRSEKIDRSSRPAGRNPGLDRRQGGVIPNSSLPCFLLARRQESGSLSLRVCTRMDCQNLALFYPASGQDRYAEAVMELTESQDFGDGLSTCSRTASGWI